MSQVIVKQKINQPKAIVWQTISEFPEVADANPYVHKSYSVNNQSNGKGAIRHCDLNADGSDYSEEQIVNWVEGEKYQIKMVGGTSQPPVDNLVITLQVQTLNESSSELSMSFDYQPRWGVIGKIINSVFIHRLLRGVAHNTLMGYKIYIETGNTIDSMKSMQTLIAQSA